MLYNLLISFVDEFSALNVFRYLTFRTGLSVMSSMIIVFLIGGPFIKFIETHKFTGPIRDDGPLDHIVKKVGTPTMGGVLILIGILFGTLLWADLSNSYIDGNFEVFGLKNEVYESLNKECTDKKCYDEKRVVSSGCYFDVIVSPEIAPIRESVKVEVWYNFGITSITNVEILESNG